MTISILHCDEALVIVDKPSGLAVHRGLSADTCVAVDLLAKKLGRRIWPVHRLDAGTSGALLFALSIDAARELRSQFDSGSIHRQYLALVRGRPPASATVDSPVPR